MLFKSSSLNMQSTFIKDSTKCVLLSALPNLVPKLFLRLKNVTPLIGKLWNIALYDVESNIIETENGKYFGAGKDKEARFWNAVQRQALIAGMITKDIENYGLLKLTDAGHGFIEKPFRDKELIESIDLGIAKDLENRRNHSGQVEYERRYSTLSEREKEVLELVVDGIANKTIAYQLSISKKTAEFHRKNVMTKIQADSFAQLVKWTARREIY